MKRRILTVALAVVLALLGTVGVLAYVRQADTRAIAGMRAVTTLIAQQQIPAGTPASTAVQDGMLRTEQLPASSVPANAVRSITADLSPLVMSATVQPGQLLLRPMLVTSAQATGTLAIPKGMVAVTIALCIPEAVAGNVQAGSRVAVFDTYVTGKSRQLSAGQNCVGPHQQQSAAFAHTQIVLPRVEVLSVGQAAATSVASSSATGAGGAPNAALANQQSNQNSQLITLAVDQADAERLIQLTESGLPYLALLTDSSQTSFGTAVAPLPHP